MVWCVLEPRTRWFVGRATHVTDCPRVALFHTKVEGRAHAPPDDEHRRTVPTPKCVLAVTTGWWVEFGGEVEHETIARLKCSIPKSYKTCVETHIS